MRLIDADALIEFCAERWIPLNIDAVNMQPTAQPDHTADIGKKAEGDCISRQAAIAAITDELMPSTPLSVVIRAKNRLKDLPAVQPDHTADIGKKVSISCAYENDVISRKAAIDVLDEQIEQCNKALGSFDISPKDEYAIKVERASLKAYRELLENLPSAQPERNGKWIYNSPTTMKCDRCGFAIKDWDWHRFKYCPNCRADMRKGK